MSFSSWYTWLIVNMIHKWDLILHSGAPAFFWVRPKWTVAEIPDQTGRVVIVTGGNSGTGYATCKALYDKGAKVYLACRDKQRGEEAIENIKKGGDFFAVGFKFPKSPPKDTGKRGELVLMQLDLADISSIDSFVKDFESRESKLDVLFGNAGVMASPGGLYTKQGYTLQFGTNALGHQHLVSLLLPLLVKTSQANPSDPPRVIMTSSAGHATAPAEGVKFESVIRDKSVQPNQKTADDKPVKGANELGKWPEYGQSKWGNIAVARYLHWVYGPSEGRKKETVSLDKKAGNGEIISIALHPGLIASGLGRHLSGTDFVLKWAPWIASTITKTPADGATNQLWVATCPTPLAKKLSGEYIVPFQNVGAARPDLDDGPKVERVWNWCEAQVKRNE